MKNIIIQAGGLGTRLKSNTKNKPKCLVPVNGKPILQYTLEMYPDSNFFIIADYKIDILKKYINLFYSKYNITVVETKEKGTCSGIAEAAKIINNNESVLLIWSDLILEKKINKTSGDVVVYKTNSVTCRYHVKENKIIKETSDTNGIVGVFSFKNKLILESIQTSGSFVGSWLQEQKNIKFSDLQDVKEIGTLELLEKNSKKLFCRFFNSVEIIDNKVVKKCIDPSFQQLSEDENNWYNYIINKKYKKIPNVYNFNPLTLEYINSKQCHKHSYKPEEKINILKNISSMMLELHNIDSLEKNAQDLEDVYLHKTLNRVNSVSSLIPFFKEETLIINNKKYINPFHPLHIEYFKKYILNIPCEKFYVIHGDPTFSNILVKQNLDTILIDPRGSFGKTKIFGDKDYDYSKIYYSLIGNYDSINSKNYQIEFNNKIINYWIRSNNWESLEDLFYKLFPINKQKNLILNSIIWFSLCGYVIEDYDAILLAFCKGIEYWNKFLQTNYLP